MGLTRRAKMMQLRKRHTTLFYRIQKEQHELAELDRKLTKLAEQERKARHKAYDKREREAARKLRGKK